MNQIVRMIVRVFIMQLMRRGTGRLIDSAINSASRRARQPRNDNQSRPQMRNEDPWQDDRDQYLEDARDENFDFDETMRNDRRAKMRRFR